MGKIVKHDQLINKNSPEVYTMIRQPYRITMARWDFTPVQKRILTKIVSVLQKEITLVEKGLPFGQLDLFQKGDTVELELQLGDLVKNGNNYAHVKKALQDLRKLDVQIELPPVISKKSKMPEDDLIITGLIERALIRKNARTVKIYMHRATAKELVMTSHGLTVYAEDVMFLTDNSYTQKIYEIISHWKDKDSYCITPDDFRKKLSLESKYPQLKDLIRRVIKPAEVELKEIGDIYFEFSTTKSGVKITKFNFIIKHRKTLHEEEVHLIKLREDTVNLLRQHFKFKDEHFAEIQFLLHDLKRIQALRAKITDLVRIIQERNSTSDKIVSVPKWTVASLLNEFPNH